MVSAARITAIMQYFTASAASNTVVVAATTTSIAVVAVVEQLDYFCYRSSAVKLTECCIFCIPKLCMLPMAGCIPDAFLMRSEGGPAEGAKASYS